MTVRRAAQWVLVALGALAVARLTPGLRGSLAYLAVSLIGALVALVAARRLPAVAAWDIAALAVVVATVVAAEPSRSWAGLPTPGALTATLHALAHTGGLHFPARATPGVVAAGSLLAGIAAAATVVTRGAWCAPPSLVLASWTIVALPSVGAALLGLAVVAAAAPLLLERVGSRSGWAVTGAALGAGACCLIALGSSPGIALGSSTGASAGGGSQGTTVHVNASTLLEDVPGIETHDANAVMFTARSALPTYWQVASLTVLSDNGVWQPDSATATILTGATIDSRSTFGAQVTVASFVSRLLAVPPGTVSVPGATVTPQGVLADGAVSPGDHYVARAPVPPYVPPDATVSADPADLVLPPQPAAVTQIAATVTAAATTPLQKAEALVDWFRSGAFHYSLRAPATSLVQFLTTTRTGSCQQFAGAFALLARAVGLPTRVAVGFTGGRLAPGGGTVVRGADAHAWPQVLLDGQWVSFEPTPQRPGGGLTPQGVLGPAAIGKPNPATRVTLPHPPPSHPVTHPTTPGGGTTPARPVVHPAAAASSTVPFVIVGSLVVAAAAALWLFLRRRRARERRDPRQRVTESWRRIDRTLAREGLGRPEWRTPSTHVERLRTDVSPAVFADLETVAGTLERSAYAGTPLTALDGDEVEAAARRVVRGARTGRSTSPV